MLKLFLEFLKIGLFTFGGSYGAVPIIRESVVKNGWLTEEAFLNMIAVSESTPGPIMVNMATYVGGAKGGFLGALLATAGVVLPSFAVIILVSLALKRFTENRWVKAAFFGVRPAVTGMIIAAGIYIILNCLAGGVLKPAFDVSSLIIFAILAACLAVYRIVAKKSMGAITIIILSAVLGIVFY